MHYKPAFSALSCSVKRTFCCELEVNENKNMNMKRIPQKIFALRVASLMLHSVYFKYACISVYQTLIFF